MRGTLVRLAIVAAIGLPSADAQQSGSEEIYDHAKDPHARCEEGLPIARRDIRGSGAELPSPLALLDTFTDWANRRVFVIEHSASARNRVSDGHS